MDCLADDGLFILCGDGGAGGGDSGDAGGWTGDAHPHAECFVASLWGASDLNAMHVPT